MSQAPVFGSGFGSGPSMPPPGPPPGPPPLLPGNPPPSPLNRAGSHRRGVRGVQLQPRVLALAAVGLIVVGGAGWYALAPGGGGDGSATGAAAGFPKGSASASASTSASPGADSGATRNPFVGGPSAAGGAGAAASSTAGAASSTGAVATASGGVTTVPTGVATPPATTPAAGASSTTTVTATVTTTRTVTATATATSAAIYVGLVGWASGSAMLNVNTASYTMAPGETQDGVIFTSADSANTGCALVRLATSGTDQSVCLGKVVQLR